jgi:hypothetical protein
MQQRRNLLERFPDQTKDCPPLADHILYVGEQPHIKPIPLLLRGRIASPVDHTPRTISQPDPRKAAKGIPGHQTHRAGRHLIVLADAGSTGWVGIDAVAGVMPVDLQPA